MDKKKMIRFSPTQDLKLMREVLAENPYIEPKKWAVIGEKLSDGDFRVEARRARERTALLLITFRKEEAASQKQSGVDEDVDERVVLLQEIRELADEAKRDNERKQQTDKQEKQNEESVAQAIRKRAMEGMNKDDEKPPKTKKTTVMTYLRDKQEKEFDLKNRELELRKEEIKLQRDRFELEKEERKQSLQMQSSQNDILSRLLNKIA